MAKKARNDLYITKIRTVHGESNLRNINDGSILYLNEDEKRTKQWFKAQEQHVPMGESKFGLIRSISYVAENVKSKSDTNSDKYNSINVELKEARTASQSENRPLIDGVYYWDKKRTISTLSRSGVQFPRESHGLPDGLIKSISDQKSNVKRKIASILDTQQFKRWFGKSKAVHADGTPMIVYHGTDADFSGFDPAKGRSAMDIQGMFFSPWELDAGGHGENAGAYYLSIQNPAPEGVAYKALNRFKGQNDVGYAMRFISNNNIVRVPLSSRKSSLRRGFFSDIRSLPEGNDFMSNKT